MSPFHSQRFRTAKLALFSLLLAGCGEKAAEAPVAATATPAVSVAPSTSTQDAAKSVGANSDVTPTGKPPGALAAGAAQAAETAADKALADFKPPFPDRTNPFIAPKRQRGAASPESKSEDAVELLGFINVGTPQVILSINGQVTPIAEGTTELGVEVLSINNPSVMLKRGSLSWQATLDN